MSEEKYTGVKFRTVFLSKNIPNKEETLELEYWCRRFEKEGLTPLNVGGRSGNLSFRCDKDFIITASGKNDDVFVKVKECRVKENLVFVEGIKEPSSETLLHDMIYSERKDVNAIFHGHSEVLLKKTKKLKITITEKEFPYGSIELIDSVKGLIKDNNFIIMRNHGFLSLGKTMKEAGEQSLFYLHL